MCVNMKEKHEWFERMYMLSSDSIDADNLNYKANLPNKSMYTLITDWST